MKHSRTETGKALLWIAAGLAIDLASHLIWFWTFLYRLFPSMPNGVGLLLSFLAYALSLVGCILAYRRSGAGRYAIGAVCMALTLLIVFVNHFVLTALVDPSNAISVSNAIGVLSTLCFCAGLWYTASATAAVLRVSQNEGLAKRAAIVQGLSASYVLLVALDYIFIAANLPRGLLIQLCFWLNPLLALAALIYFLAACRHLCSITEIDPAKIEEMRNRLQ